MNKDPILDWNVWYQLPLVRGKSDWVTYISHTMNHLDNFISILFFCPSWDTLDSHGILEPLDKNILKENNGSLQFWFPLTGLPWNNLVPSAFLRLGEGGWEKTPVPADHIIFKHPEKLDIINFF